MYSEKSSQSDITNKISSNELDLKFTKKHEKGQNLSGDNVRYSFLLK